MKKLIYFILFFVVISCYSQTNLTGKWKLNTTIKQLGNIDVLLDFQKTSDTTFTAISHPKALKNIIGGIKYSLAKKSKAYKDGAFVHIYNGIIKGDTLRGVLVTPLANMYVIGQLKDGKIIGTLGDDKYGKHKKLSYAFTAVPFQQEYTGYDYVELVPKIKQTFQKNIYNAEILKTKEWTNFFSKLEEIAPKIHDDLEMFVDFSFLSTKIKMSHIALIKYNYWDNYKENDSTVKAEVSYKMLNDKTAYIKFEGFQLADTSAVRGFFKNIIEQKTPNLIFDFRGCPGGDYSSMLLASYLVNQSYDAGFFIGNKYFQTTQQIPDEKAVANIPYYNGKSLKEFLQTISNNGLLKGKVSPDKELHYTGKVYALTDNHSGSATEPIAYFLKQHNLATLVGETTAGAMLSSTTINVQDAWTLLIPVADYYTSDRFRIEQKGVTPNIQTKSDKALEYVQKLIEQKQ